MGDHSDLPTPKRLRSCPQSQCRSEHPETRDTVSWETAGSSLERVEAQTPSREEFTPHKHTGSTPTSPQRWCPQQLEKELKSRRELEKELKSRQEVLRQLKMVKVYRKKNDLLTLQELIEKWREVGNQAALELASCLQVNGSNSVKDLLGSLQIDPKILGLDDDDCE